MVPPKTERIALLEEVEDEPSKALFLRERNQRQASYRVETVNIEGMQLIQCLVKVFFGFLGRFHGFGVGQNRRAIGTSWSFHQPLCGQLLLLSFEAMFAQGAHDRSHIG